MGFLDIQGYVKRMKILTKKFDPFLEHVLNEHDARRKLEGDSFVPKDMVDLLLQIADDTTLDVKLERHGIKGFTQVFYLTEYVREFLHCPSHPATPHPPVAPLVGVTFYLASGLKINLHKSKLMGIGVNTSVVETAANLIGCSILSSPFNYLGVKVGSNMSRISSWDDVVFKVSSRLSKWKLKSLSIKK
ncbi:hypothetical protein Tco_1016045 [Tanacetum coccineum]|uniref:Uncharacterized protein n=1 Tax=Tanacetum coccineum TaxID=301880 RepID=A0ABQ5FMI7_9ASTR